MKIVFILIIISAFQAGAKSIAQVVTLHEKNITLGKALTLIEKKSGYHFIYDVSLEPLKNRRVSVDINKGSVVAVLDQCIAGLPITYVLEQQTIALKVTNIPSARVIEQPMEQTVTGTVTDENGKPFPGVSVTLKGTNTGVATDQDGRYSIRVPNGNAVLVFSSIGYNSTELAVNGRSIINLSLSVKANNLEDIVVVGYGTQKKETINGSLNTVGAKDIGEKPVLNTFQALEGESPNLIIQQPALDPGANVNINIRGIATTGNNNPLLVIDGIISQNVNDLNFLNPNDIANVTVLKDAGSAAIYGSRGANGVILVTTKSGKFNQKPTLTYNGSYGLQVPDVLVHKVSAADNAYYRNEALENSGLPPAYTPEQIQQLAAQGNGTWNIQHLIYDAPLQTQNVSISGGGPTNSYFISGGYQNQMSNFIGNGGEGNKFGYQKYNFRLNQTSVIGNFRLNAILEYTKTRNKTNSVGDNNIIADANRVPANYSWTDAAGNFLTNPVASQYNEYGVLKQGGWDQADNDRIFGNLNGTLTITKDLKLIGVFGGTIQNNGNFFRRKEVNYIPGGVYGNDLTTFDNNAKSNSFNTQLYATYNKTFHQDHNFSATLGVSSENYSESGFQLQKTLTDPTFGTSTTGTLIDATNSYNSTAIDANSLLSAFGRINYDYKNRYFLDFVFRDDASSKFAKGHRNGFFPSVNTGWVVSDESFMDNIKKTLNYLKLRVTYGVVGNNQTAGDYTYQTTYFNYPGAYGFSNILQGGAGTNLSNADLTWERAATFNVGTDFRLFNNKLTGSVDYFNKVTSNIEQQPLDVPVLFGAAPPVANVAKVRDQGWEVELTYTLKTGKVTQSFSGNVANTKNTLLQLTGKTQQFTYQQDVWQLIRAVGHPITEYYGYQTNGFYQNQNDVNTYPHPAGNVVGMGDLKFKDLNGDGKINSKDETFIGDPFPHYTFGFTYRIAYAGFDLTAFIQGVGQRTEFLRGELVEPFHYDYGQTLYEHQLNFWTPENTNARFPRLATIGSASNTNNWRTGSDLYSFNAAYVRLKNLNVGYTLPTLLTQKIGIQKLRVSLIGQNILTLSKLNFIDPETTEFDNNLSGNDFSNSARAYLLPKFYGMGLDVTF
ncbi:MAG: SusC/RagA family TonB-linked outer membrane protein [Mucilaginibacter sp.]